MPRRSLLAALVTALLAFPLAATAGTEVKVITSPTGTLADARVKPAAVEWLMTGDFMTHLHWRRWGRGRAIAAGTYHLNRCDPTCGAGHYTTVRGRLTLSHIVICQTIRLYTAASARYRSRGHWRKAEGLGEPPSSCGA